MERFPDGSVQLDRREYEILDLHMQIMVETTVTLQESARYALSALPNPDPEFARWLAGDH